MDLSPLATITSPPAASKKLCLVCQQRKRPLVKKPSVDVLDRILAEGNIKERLPGETGKTLHEKGTPITVGARRH